MKSRVTGGRPITTPSRLHGRFRKVLYYRLKVIELHCPALRQRRDDLPILARHLVEHLGRTLDRAVVGISPSALRQLACLPWPGNVCELEHAIARAVALTCTQVLGPEDYGFLAGAADAREAAPAGDRDPGFEALLTACGLGSAVPQNHAWAQITAACERICVSAALGRSTNQQQAAALLGITPTISAFEVTAHSPGARSGPAAAAHQVRALAECRSRPKRPRRCARYS